MDPQIGTSTEVTSSSRTTDRRRPSIEAGDAGGGDAAAPVIPGYRLIATWETVIRDRPDDLGGYHRADQLAPALRAPGRYAGNYPGPLPGVGAGVTTVPTSRTSTTPRDADGAIRGLRDARLRAVYCYGNRTRRSRTGGTREHLMPRGTSACEISTSSADGPDHTWPWERAVPATTPEVVRHDWGCPRRGAPISVHLRMGAP
jgi:hypothetical protein